MSISTFASYSANLSPFQNNGQLNCVVGVRVYDATAKQSSAAVCIIYPSVDAQVWYLYVAVVLMFAYLFESIL